MNCKSKMKWKRVNIQIFQCTCWQTIRNKNINKGILYFQIPLKEKDVVSFNSKGCDRNAHIKPQLSWLHKHVRTKKERIHISIPKYLCTTTDVYWQPTLLPFLMIRCTQQIHMYKHKPNGKFFGFFIYLLCIGRVKNSARGLAFRWKAPCKISSDQYRQQSNILCGPHQATVSPLVTRNSCITVLITHSLLIDFYSYVTCHN